VPVTSTTVFEPRPNGLLRLTLFAAMAGRNVVDLAVQNAPYHWVRLTAPSDRPDLAHVVIAVGVAGR
jgi:hypothetical protein